jgi:ABC-type lipoprotein export system ATPase subunit
MTLTVVVGSSGSGKTTFLNDVHKSHKCTYIRQYHNIRPYVTVSKIPNFDPTNLPYWDIYVREGKDSAIMVGGTMAGEFTAGLSGGQRKLLLFELVFQRTQSQSDLLIVLDEPFAGVTDDFIPFIVDRLNKMREKHNILLVTNDHVETLKKMADNDITVSAIDRSTVRVNKRENVDREKAILALSFGDNFHYEASSADLKFFFDVEVASNGALVGVAAFTIVAFSLFLVSFWDSSEDSAALVLVAGGIIAFFSLNPYLLALADWRNFMSEEAEALLHASKSMNKALKSLLTLTLILIVSAVQFTVTCAVINGLESSSFWVAMLFDSASLTFPFICFGLYTKLSFQAVEIFATMPFLFMIFFSTTFSPGAGVPALKELRYLFARFYF